MFRLQVGDHAAEVTLPFPPAVRLRVQQRVVRRFVAGTSSPPAGRCGPRRPSASSARRPVKCPLSNRPAMQAQFQRRRSRPVRRCAPRTRSRCSDSEAGLEARQVECLRADGANSRERPAAIKAVPNRFRPLRAPIPIVTKSPVKPVRDTVKGRPARESNRFRGVSSARPPQSPPP